jgi:DNA polymerase-3 subunit beta
MQFEINKSAILKALGNVNGAVEKRNTIPILLNVKIEAKEDKVIMTATDMDIVITSSVAALVKQDGITTVPAQMFYDIVRKIPDGSNISVELKEDGSAVKITYGRSRFSLPCLDSTEFPVLSQGDMDVNFNVKSSELFKIIDKTRFAISSDETRHYLNGLFLHGVETNSGIELRGVATDGHRLALAYSNGSDLSAPVSGVIIPKKTINEIRKISEGNESSIISFSKAKIKIISGSSVIISKLIDGEFPEYDKVIPKDNDQTIEVSKKQLFDAVDRVATIATDKNRSIKFTLRNGKISLQVSTNDGGLANEEIEVDFQGETIETGFNSRYLLEIISQINKENLQMKFKNSACPALIDSSESEDLYVIMPVRV